MELLSETFSLVFLVGKATNNKPPKTNLRKAEMHITSTTAWQGGCGCARAVAPFISRPGADATSKLWLQKLLLLASCSA
jgi:hypothetical protein